MRLPRHVLLCLALACASPAAVAAEVMAFDVSLAGLPVARLTVSGAVQRGRYAAAMQLGSTGLAAMLRRVRFAARAEGRAGPAGPVPERYAEDVDTGRRQSRTDLAWQGGLVTAGAGAGWPAPVPAAGAVDPLTALFFGLRDRPAAGLCRYRARTFDGTRRAEVALAPVAGAPDACRGSFRRLSGYTAAEMAERRTFAFILRYAPAPGGRMRAVRIEAQTIYGQAVLERR